MNHPVAEATRELTPTTEPRTKAEALEMALKWGGEWSHWNEVTGYVGNSPDSPNGPWAGAITAQWDTAEVQRLTALHSMLPDEVNHVS